MRFFQLACEERLPYVADIRFQRREDIHQIRILQVDLIWLLLAGDAKSRFQQIVGLGVFCLQKEAIAYPLARIKVKDAYEVLMTWQSNIYCVGKISIYPLGKSVVLLRKSFRLSNLAESSTSFWIMIRMCLFVLSQR